MGLYKDYNRDPKIKALKGMGFLNQGSTLFGMKRVLEFQHAGSKMVRERLCGTVGLHKYVNSGVEWLRSLNPSVWQVAKRRRQKLWYISCEHVGRLESLKHLHHSLTRTGIYRARNSLNTGPEARAPKTLILKLLSPTEPLTPKPMPLSLQASNRCKQKCSKPRTLNLRKSTTLKATPKLVFSARERICCPSRIGEATWLRGV